MSDPRHLIVLSAPSGTGKTTLVRRLLAAMPHLRLAVSHTTRRPRPDEEEGRSYYFIEEASFRRLVAEDAFAEWAEVHGNLYGTSRAEVDRLVAAGRTVLLDVDVQGGAALRRAYPDATTVFVLPPSMDVLEARLRGRGTEAEEVVQRRLGNARGEIGEAQHYGFLVVNDDLEEAVGDLRAVIVAGPLRTALQRSLVAELLGASAEGGCDS